MLQCRFVFVVTIAITALAAFHFMSADNGKAIHSTGIISLLKLCKLFYFC